MINTIIEAVSVALNKEFGDRYEIHMEEIEQGLEEPCFFISCLNPANKRFMGRRYFCTNQICIQYFPESSEKRRECNGVAARMYRCLEWIMVKGEDKPVMGTKMNYDYEADNGIMNFYVNYDMFLIRQQGNDGAMEKVTGNVTAKG